MIKFNRSVLSRQIPCQTLSVSYIRYDYISKLQRIVDAENLKFLFNL